MCIITDRMNELNRKIKELSDPRYQHRIRTHLGSTCRKECELNDYRVELALLNKRLIRLAKQA
jgi:hypothetical protein